MSFYRISSCSFYVHVRSWSLFILLHVLRNYTSTMHLLLERFARRINAECHNTVCIPYSHMPCTPKEWCKQCKDVTLRSIVFHLSWQTKHICIGLLATLFHAELTQPSRIFLRNKILILDFTQFWLAFSLKDHQFMITLGQMYWYYVLWNPENRPLFFQLQKLWNFSFNSSETCCYDLHYYSKRTF